MSDGKRFRGGLSSAMRNLARLNRQNYLATHGSDSFPLVMKALDAYRQRSGCAFGAEEQLAADAQLLDDLRGCQGSLEKIWGEMP